jgi:hypothetical protein
MTVDGTLAAKQKLITTGGTTRCEGGQLHGSLPAPSSSLSATPSYSECTAFGFVGATVSANSCNYTFHSTTETAPYNGTMDIACTTPGDGIEIKTPFCVAKVPPQSALATMSFENSGTGTNRTVAVTWNLSGITYTEGVGCNNPGTRSNGTYTGTATLHGGNEGSSYALYVGNSQTEEGAHHITAEKYPAIPYGALQGRDLIETNVGVMECSGAEGGQGGEIVSAASQINWLPPQASCVNNGFENYSVAAHSCRWQLSVPSATTFSGWFGVTCAVSGEAITLSKGSCVISFPPQLGAAVALSNEGTGTKRVIHVASPTGHLTYTVSASCPGVTKGTYTNGSVLAEWIVGAFQSVGGKLGSQEGIWLQ